MFHVEHLCRLPRTFGQFAKNFGVRSFTVRQVHSFTNSRVCGTVEPLSRFHWS